MPEVAIIPICNQELELDLDTKHPHSSYFSGQHVLSQPLYMSSKVYLSSSYCRWMYVVKIWCNVFTP